MWTKIENIFFHFVVIVLVLASGGAYAAARWINRSLDVSFMQIVTTLGDRLTGANVLSLLENREAMISYFIVMMLIVAVIVSIVLERHFIREVEACEDIRDDEERVRLRTERKERLKKYRRILLAVSAVLFVLFIAMSVRDLKVLEFFKADNQKTTVVEENYVKPEYDMVSAGKENGKKKVKTKNLLYIYMESMESTYAFKEYGGYIEKEDLIPNLTSLALDNISFSSGSAVGGMYELNRNDYTKGAIFGTTAGLPCYSDKSAESDNIVALGDILNEKGYKNEFMCGSDGDYAKRKSYLEKHGDYEVFDYYTAIDRGYIDKGYKEFWGFEDEKLYEYAKIELEKLGDSGQPFNFTMLTVDTHFPNGYICNGCDDVYEEKYMNVIACADRQIGEFIEWCRKQDWYDDTVIVITGDHLKMGSSVLSDVPKKNRRVYNCIINSAVSAGEKEKNRKYAAVDLYPTVLTAMGFDVEGSRLGLGTDLFSDKKTLIEKNGYTELNNELFKHSDFFKETFK